MSDEQLEQYTVNVSDLFMIIVIMSTSPEEALEAVQDGLGMQELIWDEATYNVDKERG